MWSIPHCILSILIGLVLSAYGLLHTISGYPGTDVFSRIMADLPTLVAVLTFVLAILATAIGLIVLIVSLRRLRRRWLQVRRRVPSSVNGRGYRDNGIAGYQDAEGYREPADWEPASYR